MGSPGRPTTKEARDPRTQHPVPPPEADNMGHLCVVGDKWTPANPAGSSQLEENKGAHFLPLYPSEHILIYLS